MRDDSEAPASFSRGISLRARLVLLVLTGVVPLLAFSLGREYLAYREAVASTGARILAQARGISRLVEQQLQARIGVLQGLTTSAALQAGDFAAFRARAEVVAKDEFPGSNLIVLGADGQQLMNTLVPPDRPLPVRPDLEMTRRMFATGRPTVSDLYRGAVGARPVIAIDVPVKRADGSVAYALSINPRLDLFTGDIGGEGLPESWLLSVLDRKGVSIARTPNPERFVGQPATSDALSHLSTEPEGIFENVSREGIPVLTAFSHVDRFGWSVAIGVPRAELVAPAVTAAMRALAVAGIVTAFGLLSALLVARQITRPIAALRRIAGAADRREQLDPPATGLRETDEVAQALRAAEERRRHSEAEERRTQETLRESERSFQYLFENSPMPKWVYDPSSLRFLAANDAAVSLYGYSHEEFLAMRIADLLLPDDHARMTEAVRQAGPYQQTYNWRHRSKDGRTIDFDGFSHSILFEGKPARMVVVVDASARKAAEEQLRQAQKMEAIGQLTGGLAHDFNNLLLVVIGNLEMLLGDKPDDPEVATFANEALDAARRGAELNRSLLAFARRQPLRPQRIDVNELVGGITRLLNRTLGERIKISLELAPDVWPVVADAAQLQAALANLANNARDAMPKGGRLTITTANRVLDDVYAAEHTEVTAGDYAMLEVSDTGTGMTPSVVAKIFEPFFTTKPRGEGTGLGLSMVFGFIKQSGGHVNVYSEPGVGTTFRLYLPRDARGVEHAAAAMPKATPPGRGETVLVVDDDAAIRRVVARLLTALGYRVQEAENAAAAVALLDGGEPIDVLFTDVVMAGKLDGFDLARLVIERWPAIRVILTSGFPDENIDRDGRLLQSIRLLTKPYQREDLARTLRDALDGAPG